MGCRELRAGREKVQGRGEASSKPPVREGLMAKAVMRIRDKPRCLHPTAA